MSKLAWQQPKRGFSSVYVVAALGLLVTGYCYGRHQIPRSLTSSPNLQQCAIDNLLGTGLPFMNASPITLADFEERRDRLANALVAEDADAFVVEPGYTFKYYGNVSQPEWEVWEPEERPFLMVVRPQEDETGTVRANTTFLCPSFEAERARLLGMPFSDSIQIVPWEEHWNPYRTLQQANVFSGLQRPPRLMVDEEMRDFIQRGLATVGFDVVGLKGKVEEVRQIKSDKEVDILRAVNTGTVEAVRQIRKCLYPGLTETEIAVALDNALRAAGLEPFFDIVLFDENASNPHGGTNGTKVLESETFVLIDVGAHLYGYSSDICRTFFPPFLEKPSKGDTLSPRMLEKLKVWDIVFKAQTQSIHQMRENSTASSVDIAAREVITDAGYGETFTHRVGHGIGIKAHESPYLNQGNLDSLLKTGMTFTSEPGIYLVDKFGVRHEDVFLVQGDGEPELLTGSRAIGPWNP
ncbi:uncharacterized protein N7446_001232 [Penicillium canescens]|uniref:Peptidase M24 domain-containing protein n=1 Tax=Penicillium canescens TaxID=5083 RepID=A0AAD6IBY9_PENCN|nr:uncharacterized protein N7446_001232 [Penicillium canescens]KAJ6043036.1 hypothetical protein N7460_004391 [Penicillium canescens]KAJ6054512.1 hypothetical protein N7444_003610 [Penicillium canescens]KAJ6073455.1 hypothetical protein N7446_001232 [Penicillium canescens]